MERLKEEIFKSVAEYAKMRTASKEYVKGDPIRYAGRVYDADEVVNLVDSALEFWLTAGHFTDEFERKLAEYVGLRFCSFVNSGSSANLLAFWSLTSQLLGERAIRRGDEVITVAAGFPTTVAPIVQFGAVPVFVDVTIPQYNVNVLQLKNALSIKTKAVFLAHTLGNPFDIAAVKAFCDNHNLWLIEDNCDALGSEYKNKKTGSFGDIATGSFYPAHHITTGEGGAVYTNNPLLHKIVRSLRDWGRDCVCTSGQDNLCGHRFDGQFGALPKGYDHKYVYSHFGFNLKATDMQAAIGVAQLGKIDGFTVKRRANFAHLKSILSGLEDKIIFPEACPNSNPSWFGFLLTCRKGVNRERVVRHLESNKIQTRMLFGGNITKQPCMSGIEHLVVGSLENTDRIMNDTFWLGVYPGMSESIIEFMADKIREVL